MRCIGKGSVLNDHWGIFLDSAIFTKNYQKQSASLSPLKGDLGESALKSRISDGGLFMALGEDLL